MEPCELSSFAVDSMQDHNPGLTLSPGSQFHPVGPWLESPDFDPLDLGIDLDFDPFAGFDQIENRLDGSQKRNLCEAFGDEPDQLEGAEPAAKKQSITGPIRSTVIEKPLGMASKLQASISSHVVPGNASVIPASSVAQDRFGINEVSLAHHVAVEATSYGNRGSDHVSPYAPVGYYPSAPALHSRMTEDTNEVLHNRLNSSRRRVDVLTGERNKYRDSLLKYTDIDPQTGKLGIQKMEAELATLRRVCSTQQQRAKQYKADLEEWRNRYVHLAKNYNSLLRDYQQLQFTTTQSADPSPNRETVSRDDWKGKYHELSQAFSDLLATFIHSKPPSPGRTYNPPSPNSLPTPSSTHASTNLSAGLPQTLEATQSVPTPISLCTSSPAIVPEITQSASASALSCNSSSAVPSPASQQASSATVLTTLSNLSAAGSTPPSNMESVTEPNVPLSVPRMDTRLAFLRQTFPPLQRDPGPVSTAATAIDAQSSAKVPKHVEVIDLTQDESDHVSATIINTAPPAATNQLTKFQQAFRKKEMNWLRDHLDDGDAARHLFNQLNQHRTKKGALKYGIVKCYEHVQTQKGIRRSLGGPFAPISPLTPNFAATTMSPAKAPDVENVRVVKKRPVKLPMCDPMDSNSYHPTDDELARMMEEELAAAAVTSDPSNEEIYQPTDDDLVRMMEEEFAGH